MEVTARKKLWTKDFLIVSLINFTITLIFYLLMVTIAAYAVEHFNASTSTAGLVSSIFIIGTLLGVLERAVLLGIGEARKHYSADYFYLCCQRCPIL